MDDLFDDIIPEIIQRVSEVVPDLDIDEFVSTAHNPLSDLFNHISDFSSMTNDAKEGIINSIVENIGGNPDTIAENIAFAANIDSDTFGGIDLDDFTSIPSDCSDNNSVSFCGNSNDSTNTDAIRYQEERLREANHNIEYYKKEIRNFNDKTSSTYQSICTSQLSQAKSKAKDAANEIQKLKQQ